MGFKWICSKCGQENLYKGNKTKDANSTCSSCNKTQRIWKLRPAVFFPTDSNKIQQKPLEFPTPKYRTTARNKGRDITIEVDYNIILKCMERGISTIKNKPEVKAKSGGYYWDYVAWTKEFEKLKLLEMGDAE